jgi:hypothetical protein
MKEGYKSVAQAWEEITQRSDEDKQAVAYGAPA